MIDGDSCVNIISNSAIEKMGLKLNHTHNSTILLELIRVFILLSNIILCQFSFQITVIIYGVTF